jgi:hypothetical protein
MSDVPTFELREDFGPFGAGTTFELVGELKDLACRDVKLTEQSTGDDTPASVLVTVEDFHEKFEVVAEQE